MLDAGEMPHLAALQRRGGLSRVATTTPAQTPVAWSTFATGLNPGGHGIFDFLRRDPATYLPDLALNRYERKNAFSPPKAVNGRKGRAIWDVLTDAGIPSTVIRCPCTYPAEPIRGRLLAGMGVPDLRGGLGTATFMTTLSARPGEAEAVATVVRNPDGSFTTALIGPRNPKDRTDARVEIQVIPDPSGDRATIACAGGSPRELTIERGRWSEWVRVKFKLGMFQSTRGMVRFYLERADSELILYASPVNFDPEAPPFPISAPASYAGELAEEIGTYYTAGMIEDHAGLSNGRFDEAAFLDQCDHAWDDREAMLRRELDRFEEGFLFCLFDTPDRVQHMLWRHREPDHPANAESGHRPEYARAIEETYKRADAVVGEVLRAADHDTLVIALSDHGFGSFRRGVNLNTWLYENGYLALAPGVRPGEEAGDMLRHVDWSRTKAYALGLGGVYLNMAGREAQGIVRESEADALKTQIAASLSGLDDQGRGPAIRSVHAKESLYRGLHAADAPDLVAYFSRGYRASWGTAMGGVPEAVIEDNTKAWGGDHIIDPALVPGFLAMNRPFRGDGARLVDLAPTILGALGVSPGPAMEGGTLLS
jgi:predicted AlkP superfamily phosphohydrolase/phosphomutase